MILYLVLQIQSSSKFQLQIIWAKLQLMWAQFLIEAIKVSRNRISFAFNLGQFYALSAGRVVFDFEPQQIGRQIDFALVSWAKRKYKKLKPSYKRAVRWIDGVKDRKPRLFVHWNMAATVQ